MNPVVAAIQAVPQFVWVAVVGLAIVATVLRMFK